MLVCDVEIIQQSSKNNAFRHQTSKEDWTRTVVLQRLWICCSFFQQLSQKGANTHRHIDHFHGGASKMTCSLRTRVGIQRAQLGCWFHDHDILRLLFPP